MHTPHKHIFCTSIFSRLILTSTQMACKVHQTRAHVRILHSDIHSKKFAHFKFPKDQRVRSLTAFAASAYLHDLLAAAAVAALLEFAHVGARGRLAEEAQ